MAWQKGGGKVIHPKNNVREASGKLHGPEHLEDVFVNKRWKGMSKIKKEHQWQ